MKIKSLCLTSFTLLGALGCGVVAEDTATPTPAPKSDRGAQVSCPNTPAPKLMTHAICLCDGFSAVGRGITTTAPALGGAANVGINGVANVVGHYEVQGSLWAYKGIRGVGTLNVRDDAVTFGSAQGVGHLAVGKNLAVKGDLSDVGDLKVGGLLKVGGRTQLVGQSGTVAPVPFDLTDAQPCGCDAASKLDITKKITDAKSNGKVAPINSVGQHSLTLKTGSYYLEGGIQTVGGNTITIEGAVALFVNGSINTVGEGLFDVKAGSTLDLYVNGSIASVGHSVFTAAEPGAVRLYLGGTRPTLSSVGLQDLALSIYAPDADLQLVGDSRIRGSVFARSIQGVGHLQVDYAAPVGPASGTCDPKQPPDDIQIP